MGISEFVTAILGSGVLLAAFCWLAREIIKQLLSRDIEKFKANLQMESQREIAHLKSSLELVAFEHQTRFSVLHEKRAEIIANLYGKIVDLYKAANFVRLFQSMNDSEKEKKCKLLLDTFDSSRDFFGKHRIYFDKDCCAKIVSFMDKLSIAFGTLASFVEGREAIKLDDDQEYEEWDKAMRIMEQEIPVVKNALEESFRELLGVLQTSNKSFT
jgi:hypothetical protein